MQVKEADACCRMFTSKLIVQDRATHPFGSKKMPKRFNPTRGVTGVGVSATTTYVYPNNGVNDGGGLLWLAASIPPPPSK